MKKSAGVLFSGLAVGLALVGQDEKTQDEAVSKMLKDEKGNDPAQLEITGTRMAVQAFCQTVGKQDSKIKEAPHLS